MPQLRGFLLHVCHVEPKSNVSKGALLDTLKIEMQAQKVVIPPKATQEELQLKADMERGQGEVAAMDEEEDEEKESEGGENETESEFPEEEDD